MSNDKMRNLFFEQMGQNGEDSESLLCKVGLIFSSHMESFKECRLAYSSMKSTYVYRPLIGESVAFTFFYDQQEVFLSYLGQEESYSFEAFTSFLSLIDLLFSPIYALGSVVELDSNLLPEDLVNQFRSHSIDLYALITGRRVLLEDSDYYVDYIGSVWPYGLQSEVPPLFFSNLNIQRLVYEGYTDSRDYTYSQEELREQYLYSGYSSSLYAGGLKDEN